MIALMKKEMTSLLMMPMVYVILALYLFFSSIFIYFFVISSSTNNLLPVFDRFDFLIALINPILASRAIADELKQKTYELLFSSPHTLFSIVAAKYFANVLFFFLALALTFFPLFLLSTMTPLYWSAIFLGYIRLFLVGCSVIALGMFASSLTESVFLAAFLAIIFSLLSYLFSTELNQLPFFFAFIVRQFSFFSHADVFRMGIFSVGSVIYFVFYIFSVLMVTTFLLERKR